MNGRRSLAATQERLAPAVDREIGLTGAAITGRGRGTLKLCATPGDVPGIERYLERRPSTEDSEPIAVVAATPEACEDIYL